MIEQLIDKHNGERTFFDGELVGAYFTVKNLERLCNEYASQKLKILDFKEIEQIAINDDFWFGFYKDKFNYVLFSNALQQAIIDKFYFNSESVSTQPNTIKTNELE